MKIMDIKNNVAPGGLTIVIRGESESIPIKMGERVAGTRIATLLGRNHDGCNIRVSRGKISLALMPVNIIDYKCTPAD